MRKEAKQEAAKKLRELLKGRNRGQEDRLLSLNKLPSPQRGEGTFVGDERAVQMRVRGLIPNKVFSPFTFHFSRKRYAFTLAEVLITLGIIGVVAAMTLPTLIHNYRKQSIETKLKKSYSLLSQTIKRAEFDNDTLDHWDYSLTSEEFGDRYILPYIKAEKINRGNWFKSIRGGLNKDMEDALSIQLADGSIWHIRKNTTVINKIMFLIDIDGKQGHNESGKDIFFFEILPEARWNYNCGWGDFAKNITVPGIYYDGYNIDDTILKTYEWRGCLNTDNNKTNYAFCTAIIVKNNWKIPNDYPRKF